MLPLRDRLLLNFVGLDHCYFLNMNHPALSLNSKLEICLTKKDISESQVKAVALNVYLVSGDGTKLSHYEK